MYVVEDETGAEHWKGTFWAERKDLNEIVRNPMVTIVRFTYLESPNM